MGDYNKLYTPEDSVIVFIDYQPQMTFGVASIDRATLINNVTLLARGEGVQSPHGSHGRRDGIVQRLHLAATLDVFPGQPVVERT